MTHVTTHIPVTMPREYNSCSRCGKPCNPTSDFCSRHRPETVARKAMWMKDYRARAAAALAAVSAGASTKPSMPMCQRSNCIRACRAHPQYCSRHVPERMAAHAAAQKQRRKGAAPPRSVRGAVGDSPKGPAHALSDEPEPADPESPPPQDVTEKPARRGRPRRTAIATEEKVESA